MRQEMVLPAELSQHAERGSWFNAHDALRVLDWIEQNGCRFLGFDSAREDESGKWVLLPDPILDLSSSGNAVQNIEAGRQLIGRHPDLMFDLVWN